MAWGRGRSYGRFRRSFRRGYSGFKRKFRRFKRWGGRRYTGMRRYRPAMGMMKFLPPILGGVLLAMGLNKNYISLFFVAYGLFVRNKMANIALTVGSMLAIYQLIRGKLLGKAGWEKTWEDKNYVKEMFMKSIELEDSNFPDIDPVGRNEVTAQNGYRIARSLGALGIRDANSTLGRLIGDSNVSPFSKFGALVPLTQSGLSNYKSRGR